MNRLALDFGMDLQRFCAGHLSVLSSYQETAETMKHMEDFKRETVRITLSSGLSRLAADLGIGKMDFRPSEQVSGLQD